ncbi:MAG: class I SAM-dependent methyltransferase [Alphaproteobacteria bacterium]|nr:class I SAM-dependent methyltransferase [Alphaproteobacteria bacterium]
MKWILAAALLATTPAFATSASAAPANVSAAVADSARPDEDKQLDAERKPAEMLVLAKVRPGARVMDLIPGRGYFTRLFSVAVGPKGYVYAYQPSEFDSFLKGKPAPVIAVAANYKNVSVIHASVNALAAPETLDLVWTSQNYHDLHDSFAKPADLAVINKKVYDALKPGGLYIVLDHAAEKGSGLRDTETLHRIDEATVKNEVLAAGFKLASESRVLRNPADNHKLKVFDPAIRHKTDQFILIFRK